MATYESVEGYNDNGEDRYRVVKGNEVLKDGFATESDAVEWLQSHVIENTPAMHWMHKKLL